MTAQGVVRVESGLENALGSLLNISHLPARARAFVLKFADAPDIDTVFVPMMQYVGQFLQQYPIEDDLPSATYTRMHGLAAAILNLHLNREKVNPDLLARVFPDNEGKVPELAGILQQCMETYAPVPESLPSVERAVVQATIVGLYAYRFDQMMEHPGSGGEQGKLARALKKHAIPIAEGLMGEKRHSDPHYQNFVGYASTVKQTLRSIGCGLVSAADTAKSMLF
ncbi:hypothetical protein HYS48_01710 [Candidatus Woesearchaeota archaeon]|nr:hypothetical protein [Candidatus Woesearchaeota archaeon]